MTRKATTPRTGRLAAVAILALLMALPVLAGTTPATAPAPEVAWTNERPGDGAIPRGIVALGGPGGAGFAVVLDTRVDRFDANGALLWSAPDLPVFGNTIAAADVTGDGTDDVLVASAAIFEPPAMLTALDGTDGAVLWSVPTGGAQVNDIVVSGTGPDAIVIIAAMPGLDDGRVEAHRAGDGEALWSEPAGDVVTSLASLGVTIAAGTQNGMLLHHATHTGTRLSQAQLDGGFVRDLVPVPGVVAGVTLVAVTDGAVVGLSGAAADGVVGVSLAEEWTYTADARFWSGSAEASELPLHGATVFVNAWNGAQVHALDSATGTPRWTAGDGGVRTSLPFLSPDSILLADVTGDDAAEVIAAGATNKTRAFDATSGALLWESPTPGPTDWLAAVDTPTGARTALAHPYWVITAVGPAGDPAWSHDLSPYQAGAAHDMNRDGTTDALVATAGHAYVIDGATGQTILAAATWPHLADAVTTNIAAADLTGDGRLDIIASARTGNIRGVVAAFDGHTGELLWTTYADYIIGGITGHLIIQDLDSDGVPDVVFGSNKGHPSHVIAVSGADGSTLWRYHVGDDVLDLDAARTDAGVRLVILHDHTSCGCFVHPGLVALDGTNGGVVWTRDVTDNDAADIAIVREPGGHDQIVVRDADDPPEDDGEPLDGDGERFSYLDPATGAETRRVLLTPLGVPALDAGPFFITGDVDGDGTDDLIFTLREPRGRDAQTQVVVLSGVDDHVLWSSALLDGTANVLAVGPPRSDGGADVLAAWAGGAVARLDGRDGSARWQHAALETPVWFLAAGRHVAGDELVFTPQGTLLQALTDP